MAIKRRKLPKQSQEEVQDDDKVSVSRLEEGEEEGPVSVNRALEKEQEEKSVTGGKGKKVPVAEAGRDPELDEEPIAEKDLGLPKDSFLLDRKVNKRDLKAHIDAREKQFLGSNIRKVRDFASIFDKGKSSPEDPKLDLAYEIHQNPVFKKELIAQQLLRNFHSEDSVEARNAEQVLIELKLMENEEFADALRADDLAHENEDLLKMLQKVLPRM